MDVLRSTTTPKQSPAINFKVESQNSIIVFFHIFSIIDHHFPNGQLDEGTCVFNFILHPQILQKDPVSFLFNSGHSRQIFIRSSYCFRLIMLLTLQKYLNLTVQTCLEIHLLIPVSLIVHPVLNQYHPSH